MKYLTVCWKQVPDEDTPVMFSGLLTVNFQKTTEGQYCVSFIYFVFITEFL